MTKRILFALLVLLLAVTAVSMAVMADSGDYTVKAIDNSDLDPVKLANGTQECPLCGTVPEWKSLDQATYAETAYGSLGDNAHVYLTEDITYTGISSFITAPTRNGTVPRIACVHLNGHNLTATQARVFMGSSGILNVMGEGTVSGDRNSTAAGSAIQINSTGAILNLYGGTYTKPATDTKGSIIRTGTPGGVINMYGPAVIDGANLTTEKDPTCLQLNGNTDKPSTFNMYGNIYVSESGKLTIAEGWPYLSSAAWAEEEPPYGAVIAENCAASTGSFTGTLTYEYDQLQPCVYAEEGKLMLPAMLLQKSDGTFAWYNTDAEALEAHLAAEGSHLQAMGNGRAFEISEGKTLVLDVNGKTVSVTGSATLQGMDSANDTYAVSSGVATVADTGTVQTIVPGVTADYRYIALGETGSYSFHRLGMRLSAVTLRAESCGLYYKAVYECDEILQQHIDSYGVVLSTQDIPGADFLTEEGAINCYTAYDKDSFVSGAEVTSGSVFGIMKYGQKKNAQRGQMKIYANAYIILDGEALVAEGSAYSLMDTLKAIDGNWAQYEQSGEAQTVKTFYQYWKDKGMSDWAAELPNIAQ